MPAHSHDDDIFREKRKIKNPISFKIKLNEEQKLAKEQILDNTLSVLAGKAGSGKTLLACQIALDGLLRRHYEKIIITRPTVSKESIGYLPGDLHQKMDPWLQPIYHNLFALYGKDKVQPLIDQDKIEIVPVAFMRGRTFLDACLIEGDSILTKEKGYMKVEDIFSDAVLGTFYNVKSYNFETQEFEWKLLDAISPANTDSYIEIELEDGSITKVSPNHQFYTQRGLIEARDLLETDEILSL